MFNIDLIGFFAAHAYEPLQVYGFIVLFMTASSFGFPIPEEVVLVSAGLVAYMAGHPEAYPPPTPGAEGVNLLVLCAVCFFAVLGSDILIYFIGKIFGRRIVQSKFFNERVSQERFNKINNVFNKYSHWACGLFRFTPGVRFPGHLSCGLMGVPLWKFVLIDGCAALISVPTQVFLVSYYGEVILEKFKEFKLAVGAVLLAFLAFWILKRLYQIFSTKKARD